MTAGFLRKNLEFTMPFSNVLHLSFPDKLRATKAAGFSGMTIQPQEVLKLVAEGTSISDMRSMANDAGLTIARLDPLCPWVPDWKPTNFDESYAVAHDISPSVFFNICEQMGCSYMSLNATFPADRYNTARITEFYARICRQAAEHGMTCDLECIPMWGVVSLEQGWEIVKNAGVSNGGFVFDVTHFVRGQSSIETLRQIPGDLIHCVQICDGHMPLRPGVTLELECFERLWPGEGTFPISNILAVLDEIGGLRQIGPEVFSATMKDLSAEQVAARSLAALVQYPTLSATR